MRVSANPWPHFGSLRSAALASTALVSLIVGAASSAQAELLNPAVNVPVGCQAQPAGSTTTFICSGNLSTGVVASGDAALPAVTTPISFILPGTVNNLTVQNVTTTLGGAGVVQVVPDNDLTLIVDATPNGINSGFNGISAEIRTITGQSALTAPRTLTLTSSGDIQATTNGIDASVAGNEPTGATVVILSNSNIQSAFRGILAQTDSNGAIDITSNGTITVNGALASGPFGGFLGGIVADNIGAGSVIIQANDDVQVTNTDAGGFAVGIQAPGGLGDPTVSNAITITTAAGTTVSASAATSATGISATADLGTIDITSDSTLITATSAGQSLGIEATLGNNVFPASGGLIRITSNGAVEASDIGILATSNATTAFGGGVIVDSNGTLTVLDSDGDGQAIGISASTTLSGDVNVDASQAVTVSGTDAIGLLAVANGTGDAIATASNTVNAQAGATGIQIGVQPGGTATANVVGTDVLGGTTSAISFTSLAGSTNVLNTSGPVTLSAISGVAVLGGAGNTTINNTGLLSTLTNGDIRLDIGGGTNAFNNQFGSTFNSGAIVNLGADNLFTNAGTLSLGGSSAIATTTLTGNLIQTAFGTFQVDIDAGGTADLLTVNGTADLSGNLAVTALNYPSGYPDTQSYTVLTATGGVTGAFDQVTDNLPDADIVAIYNPNDVVIQYTRAGPQTALSDKSIHANSLQEASRVSRLFAEAIRDRAAGRQLASAGSFVSSSFALGFMEDETLSDATNPDHSFEVWIGGLGAFANVDRSATVVGYDVGTAGLAGGLDWVATLREGTLRTGLAAGYTETGLNSEPGDADITTSHFGASASFTTGPWLLAAAAAVGFQETDITRLIPIAGAPTAVARSSVDGRVFEVAADMSYDIAEAFRIAQGSSLRVAPVASFDYVHAARDAYVETGAGILNLAIQSDTFERAWLGAGIEFAATFGDEGSTQFTPSLAIKYEYALGGGAATVNTSLAGVAGAGFTDSGALLGEHALALNAGLEISYSDSFALTATYAGSYSDVGVSHRGGLTASLHF